jgi:hypothetical protein
MTMTRLDASARLAEPRCPKILIVGPTAVGKTSLLKTLPTELLPTVLLADLESGDLPIADLPIASVRPQTWADCRDLACVLGGPDPARAPGSAYSQSHYDALVTNNAFVDLQKYSIVFIDSYTEASRRCRVWAEQQPESINAYGKKDLRGTYGLVARELIAFTQQLQHMRTRVIVLVAILERVTDDYGASSWRVQLEGQRTARELPAILDVIITMQWLVSKDGKAWRAFICQPNNSWAYPAKDRSGRLSEIEEPHLGKLLAKIAFRPTRGE